MFMIYIAKGNRNVWKRLFERVGIQKIGEYLQWGGDSIGNEEGTRTERACRHTDALMEELHRYREKVLATDWDAIPTEKEQYVRTERLYSEVLKETAALETVGFQAGFVAGVRFLWQVLSAPPKSD